MLPPNYTQDLPPGAQLIGQPTGQYIPSQVLIQLLVNARSAYDWPAGNGAQSSQQTIRNLEGAVAHRLAGLNVAAAHGIVIDVSSWAGNNTNSHVQLVGATHAQQAAMKAAITDLITPGREGSGIDALCGLPGINLVIASKIFRFCAPHIGAAVDRHASYFFNSLPVAGRGMSTNFVREWSNGRHASSRLAIYTSQNYRRNRAQYLEIYLPLLANIANAMNALQSKYICAATNQARDWTPADIEMAAYYWWACNGSR